MGGKISEFKGERIFREGEKKGKKEGRLENILELVHDRDLPFEAGARRAEKWEKISREEFRKPVDSYSPDSDEYIDRISAGGGF